MVRKQRLDKRNRSSAVYPLAHDAANRRGPRSAHVPRRRSGEPQVLVLVKHGSHIPEEEAEAARCASGPRHKGENDYLDTIATGGPAAQPPSWWWFESSRTARSAKVRPMIAGGPTPSTSRNLNRPLAMPVALAADAPRLGAGYAARGHFRGPLMKERGTDEARWLGANPRCRPRIKNMGNHKQSTSCLPTME